MPIDDVVDRDRFEDWCESKGGEFFNREDQMTCNVGSGEQVNVFREDPTSQTGVSVNTGDMDTSYSDVQGIQFYSGVMRVFGETDRNDFQSYSADIHF